MITLCFTYDTVTEEPSADGDFAESGFYERGGWKYPIDSTGKDYPLPVWEKPGDLKAFLQECESLCLVWDGGTDWLYSLDSEQDYRTGEFTSYAAHIDGCTKSTKARILRLFKWPRAR